MDVKLRLFIIKIYIHIHSHITCIIPTNDLKKKSEYATHVIHLEPKCHILCDSLFNSLNHQSSTVNLIYNKTKSWINIWLFHYFTTEEFNQQKKFIVKQINQDFIRYLYLPN